MVINKSVLLCQICKKVLKDPVNLPCQCTICDAHLKTAKDGLILCEVCGDEFVVKNIQCKVNKLSKKILDAEDHLSTEEKELGQDIRALMFEFQRLYDQLSQEQNIFELKSHEHFAEIKRRIDIQREQLKDKIDVIYLAMIKQVEQHETFYKQKLEESCRIKMFDLSREKEILDEELRQMEIKIERVQQLKTDNEANVKDLLGRLDKLKFMSQQKDKCAFEAKKGFEVESFGALNLRTLNIFLVSCSDDKCIKLWDLETKECIRTIEDHTTAIISMNVLENGHLISGSTDNKLNIWNPADGACLKTIDVTYRANQIQVLSGNRVACDSRDKIKIWNLNDGTCIQTLEGSHTGTIHCIIALSDETLVSASEDRTIKIWKLDEKKCINTFHGHTSKVYCLLVLKDGRLASGSEETIKIWNMASGECTKTLQGHNGSVKALESTEKFELISCSSDESIKIWDLTSGQCIRTLNGHAEGVYLIRICKKDLLVIGSQEGLINLWDLASGQCTHTLDEHRDSVTGLCFI